MVRRMDIPMSEVNAPTITDFRSKDIGSDEYVIFKTTVEELTAKSDNTPVIDAQIRALEAALADLKSR